MNDADGTPANIRYQWFADGKPIAGATAQTFTLTAAQQGAKITVQATYTDLAQHAEAPQSAATAAVSGLPPQNHAPTDITLSAATVAEGKDGASVGKLTTTDPDAGDAHRYTVSDARFEVTADGTLQLKAGLHLDYAAEKTIALTVTATDAGGLATQKTFTLSVQDDPNYPAPNPQPNPNPQPPSAATLTVRETDDATPGSIVVGKLGAGEALTVGETTLNTAKLADLAREPRTVIDDAKGTLTLTGYDAASGTLTYRYDPKEHASPNDQQATVDFIIGREAFRGTNGVGVQPFNPRWAGDDSTAIEESYARAAALGVKWVRITAGWNQVQPQDDGSYDWRYVDDAVRLAQKYGMKVLMQVMGTPNWASDIGDLPAAQQQKLAQEGYWTSTHAPKPQHDAAFARFFGEAVKRYSAQGIHDYEFWNEPGNKFWRDSWANPNPNPEHYTRLLKLVYEAAHAADAEANVLAGGMTVGDSRADGSYISPQEFLERMYKAGAQGYFDALSHHPYGILAKDFKDNGWAQMNGDIVAPGAGEKTLMQILREHGDGDKLIWPSEVGWDAMFAGLAETYQANVLKTLLEWQQKADYTGPMILYQAQNDRAAYVQGILNRDDNGDGIVDVNIDTNGDGIPDANIDADHNNRPDLLDAADREAYYGFWKNDGSEKPAVGVIKSGTPQTPAAATLNITIENVDTPAPQPQNHAPDDITLSTATVAEGKDGATVGKLTAHDPDSGDTHTYKTSDDRFEVAADGTLKLKAGQHLDHAAEPTVKLTVTATDAGGLSTQKTFTLNVQDDPAYPAPNQPGNISITGEAKVGSTLTATVKDADNFDASAVKYQWFADGNPIGGATAQTFTLTAAQKGAKITVQATYDDNSAHHETPTSAATAPTADDAQTPPNYPVTDGNDIMLRVNRAEKSARDSLLKIEAASPDEIADLRDGKWGQSFTERLQKALDDPNIRIIDMPAGTHRISSVVLDRAQDKHIRGQGSATVLEFDKTDDVAPFLATSGGKAKNLLFSEFSLDMSWKTGDAAVNAFQFTNADSMQVYHVAIKNVGGSAILAQGFRQAGSGSKNLLVLDSVIDGAGLIDHTDGFGVMVKDDSPNAAIVGNQIHNVKGGMAVGGHATTLGAPVEMVIIDNHVGNQQSTTAFEGIGITKGVDRSIIAKNISDPSFDNGISVTSDDNLVVKNHIGSAWNHGIAIDGKNNTVVANEIHNIGRQNAALGEIEEYAAIAIENGANNYIANNTASGGDMVYAVKYNGQQLGDNQIGHNDFSGYSKREFSIPPHSSDKTDASVPDTGLAPQTATERAQVADEAGPSAGAFNHAPTDIGLSALEVPENLAGATVGKLTTHDPDAGDTHTYKTSDDRFEVTSDGTLKLKAGQHLDYASEPTVKLTVTATDAGGLSTQKTFTLNVQDDPAPPTVGARESGLNLDIARHFYSADVIKQFIDTLAKAGGTFLHLHLSDHENYALESALLGQRAQDATRDSAGNHVNPHTGKPFLSTAQVAELASYAKAKGIELVPELETPSHMNAIFRLLALEKGEDYVKALQAANSDPAAREIDITRPQSLAFVQALAQEIVTAFGDSARHLHLGGDEFGYSAANNHEYINYINQMAAFLAQHGLKTRIWNDGVIKANLASLDHTIEITYWSHDGRQDGSIGETNRALRASVPELLDAGFNVLNYNAGYLYAVPKQGMGDSTDSNYDSRLILRDWNLGIWDEKNHANAVDGKRLKGAALSIWGENAGTLDDASIARYYADEITTLVEKTRALDDPALAQTLQNRAANDFAALQQDTWLDFEQIANHATLDLGGNGSQHLRLLREDTLDAARGLDIRIKGTDADRITLGDNWHATGDSQTEGGEQYRAYENNGNRLWIDSDIAVQNAAPTSAADTFARDNLPPGAAYQIVADLGAAKTAIAADPTLQNLIISDGDHHALLQKNSTGYSDNMPPGWTLACKNHIPAVAFHDGGADLAPALNAAAQAAKTLQLGIELPAQREYQLGSQIVLENGVPYLHGNGSTLAVQNSVNEAALKLPNGASQGEISGLTLNMNAAPGVHGILGYDLHDYRIHDNHILHLGQRPGHPGYGITVYSGSGHTENITVENNHISAKPGNGAHAHADAPVGIAFNGAQQPGNPQWRDAKAPVWRQYVEDGTVAEADPSRTIKHITVRGNQVSGTYYGVAFSTVSDSEISGNHLHHNTRNISLQDRSNHNTVRDNILTDAHSSAIHIAYASSDNHIENNHIMTTRAGGQAILQAYQGSKNNHYHNNHIDVAHDATTNFMYTATDSSGTTYRDNIASGRVSRASIGAESIWDKAGAGDEKSAYGNNMQDPNLYDGDITHGGGHGALTGLTISGNILAPEPTFAGAPITYLGADSSHGLHGDKTLHGDLDATLNDNTWLGADGREAIRQHQSGDSHVHLHGNGITHADGTTYHHGTTAYSIGDYTLANDETTLYLLGTHATSGSGNSGDNQLYGNAQTNRLSGGAGNDHLDGGYGADTLTGGAGADTFTFASLLDGKNIDTITDFNAGEGDKIALNQAVFGRLGDNWYTAAGQHITHTTRVYQQGDTLYHDPDGNGSAYSATAFAKVNVTLEEGHFTLI